MALALSEGDAIQKNRMSYWDVDKSNPNRSSADRDWPDSFSLPNGDACHRVFLSEFSGQKSESCRSSSVCLWVCLATPLLLWHTFLGTTIHWLHNSQTDSHTSKTMPCLFATFHVFFYCFCLRAVLCFSIFSLCSWRQMSSCFSKVVRLPIAFSASDCSCRGIFKLNSHPFADVYSRIKLIETSPGCHWMSNRK